MNSLRVQETESRHTGIYAISTWHETFAVMSSVVGKRGSSRGQRLVLAWIHLSSSLGNKPSSRRRMRARPAGVWRLKGLAGRITGLMGLDGGDLRWCLAGVLGGLAGCCMVLRGENQQVHRSMKSVNGNMYRPRTIHVIHHVLTFFMHSKTRRLTSPCWIAVIALIRGHIRMIRGRDWHCIGLLTI